VKEVGKRLVGNDLPGLKAGIDQARKDGKPHGRPMTAGKLVPQMKQLRKDGISKRAIAKQLGCSVPGSVRHLNVTIFDQWSRLAYPNVTIHRDKIFGVRM
jgi:hypothetical protein